MDFSLRKKYYNLCNPLKPLEPGDPQNIDLDTFDEKAGRPVRGINWTGKLVKEIALSDDPVTKFFTALPGSGKTTELLRLVKRLSDPYEGNLFQVVIDAEELLDISDTIDPVDIVLAIIFSVEKAVLEKKNGDPEVVMEHGFLRQFWNFLLDTDTLLARDFSVPLMSRLVYELKDRKRLRERVRQTASSGFSRFTEEANEELGRLKDEAIREFNRVGIIVILDSLDKLSGITSEKDDVLASAERVFRELPAFGMPVHVLCTLPVELFTRIRSVDFLPMIKVRERNGDPCEKGLAAALEIIEKRLPEEALNEIFGTAPAPLLEKLIMGSGGSPREILQMLQKAIMQTEHPVTEDDLHNIFAETAREYRITVPGEAVDWLAKVASSKFLAMDDDHDIRMAEKMLACKAVMKYLDLDLWFDLHPAVYEIPEVKKAIAGLQSNE